MRCVVLSLALLVAGCGSPNGPNDNEVVLNLQAIGTTTGYEQCHDGQNLRDCVPLLAPQHFSGVWEFGFEESTFDRKDRASEPVEFEPTPEMRQIAEKRWETDPRYRAYEVEFVGRRSAVVGQFGHFDTLVVVDRLLSMKEVPLPPASPE